MNSNFEWQKHQANERLERYRREATTHRQAANGSNHHGGSFLLKLALLAGIFFIAWLVTSCSSEAASAMKPETVDTAAITIDPQPAEWRMADRVSFQDKREVYLNERSAIEVTGWTLAGRILFQDRREASLRRQPMTGWTLAERILFQDKVAENGR